MVARRQVFSLGRSRFTPPSRAQEAAADGPEGERLAQFLIGQRVRIADAARGPDYPDVGHWVVAVAFVADVGCVYTVATSWPPGPDGERHDGFYAADLSLWAN